MIRLAPEHAEDMSEQIAATLANSVPRNIEPPWALKIIDEDRLSYRDRVELGSVSA